MATLLFRSTADRTLLEPFADFSPAAAASLPSSSPLSIRSLSLSYSLLHLGTGGGKIFLFSLSLSPSNPDPLFLTSTSVSKLPIDSILSLPSLHRLLALSDSSLFLIDVNLAQPPKKLGFLKGITAFCARIGDPSNESVYLFGKDASANVGKKFFRKLANGTDKSFDLGHDGKKIFKKLANNSGPRGLEEGSGGNSCCCYVAVAGAKGLVIMKLSLLNSEAEGEYGGVSVVWKEVQGFEGVKTLAWIGDSVFLGRVDGYEMVRVTDGTRRLVFSLPEGLSPRLKCLRRSEEVMLMVDNVGVVADGEGQPVGGSLVFGYVPEAVEEMGCYVVVAKDGRLDLYSRKSGVCVQSLMVAEKGGVGKVIVTSDDGGNGELVVVGTSDKVICYRKVPAEEQIKDLLRKKNFKEAINLVEELDSEGEISRELLSFVHAQVGFLLLFDLHFEDAVDHFLLSESMQPPEFFPLIMRDPNRWSHLVPRNRYWGLHPPPVPLEQVVDDGLMSIQRAIFLKKAGVETAANEAFLLNPPSRASLLQSAIENIIRYLRASREKDLLPPVKEGVDTLLMYLYRALNNVEDMEQLASSPNSCIVEELETLLDDSGHLRTLAFLYASKGMCSKALAIWRILARNYSTGFWKDSVPSAEKHSLDVSTELLSGEKTAAIEASKLLQESSDQDLVLEHVGWIAEIDQELVVMVLTSENRINQLSPDEVLAAVDPKKVEIQQRYLQWLIEDQDSDDTRFHTLYALSLAKSSMETAEICRNEIGDEMNISDVDTVGTYRYPFRERLQLFLQASDLYDPKEVLHVIEGSELWLEKAILYRKMGEETLVLKILALKLEDSDAAEQYCAEIGRREAYMELLGMYLDPKNGKEPMFKAAVRLLHNHGESLDPLQVLEKLSPKMPLQLASDTILRMLRARVHHHRQGQIVHNLSRALNLDARSVRLEERSRHVEINDESTCGSCHARLGTKLFAMYPDDSVVCYKCYRRQGESTSARGRNFKYAPIFKAGWLVTR